MLSNRGLHDEALMEVDRARRFNPLYILTNALEGLFQLHAGKLEDAESSLNNALALEPNFWMTHLFLSSLHCLAGRMPEAVGEAELAEALSNGSTHAKAARACALAMWGRDEPARDILEGLLGESRTRYIPPYHLALIFNALHEDDAALQWLTHGLANRDPKLTFLPVEQRWDRLRGNAEFARIAHRFGATSEL
jgi:tetratricopeptide (TPR) repeat protein